MKAKADSMATFGVIDLFAGPGGLAEGFASLKVPDGRKPFRIALSVEKEATAHATLQLRSFLRQFPKFPAEYYQFLNGQIPEPDWSTLYPSEWRAASKEALHLELGTPKAGKELNPRLDAIRTRYKGNTILIGGPPCQAYSLVGRARNKGIEDYNPSKDQRHFLYEEYIRILKRLQPAAFVMENVKGMLSSRVEGEAIFEKILADLKGAGSGNAGYELIALAAPARETGIRPSDFVVYAEHHGAPQARHRVIVVGLRKDRALALHSLVAQGLLQKNGEKATVRHVLDGMPVLRSGLSKSADSKDAWQKTMVQAFRELLKLNLPLAEKQARAFRKRLRESLKALMRDSVPLRQGFKPGIGKGCPRSLREWLIDPKLARLPNNETRGHMVSDLHRYLYASVFSEVAGFSPKAAHYPQELAPQHQNWKSGKFADRFRVQLWDAPSTTVTCHISKDGHYFIHPDPVQCRSLTVREAARLQTFPDNYYFKGNRTQQYIQVGNAVPPYLAKQIAEALHRLLIQCLGSQKTPSSRKKHAPDKFLGMQFQIAANMK